MSGSRWVTTPHGYQYNHGYSSFVYFYIVLLCILAHLFLISSASVRSIPFMSFIMPIFTLNIPLVCMISWKKSLVIPILLFPSISSHYSFKKAFLSLLAILWNSAFNWVYPSLSLLPFTSILYSAICKASSDNYFVFLHFSFFGMVLFPYSCIMLHHSSGTLFTRSNPLYLSPPLFNYKRFDLGHTWMA